MHRIAVTGSQEHYNRYLAEANKLPAAEVRQFRADISLALANAARGADSLRDMAAEIRAALPKVSMAQIESLADIGAAVAYAAGQVERFAPAATGTKDLLIRGNKLRALLLGSAESLVVAGILPAAQVAKVREGSGGIDTAGDCVALASLFQKNAAAVRGKVPFTAAQVKEAAEVGSRLLATLKPKGAKKATAKDLTAAAAARDRLWTLFEKTWEQTIWRAGAWVFGRTVDQRVPALQSRVVGKRPAKVTPAAANAGWPRP